MTSLTCRSRVAEGQTDSLGTVMVHAQDMYTRRIRCEAYLGREACPSLGRSSCPALSGNYVIGMIALINPYFGTTEKSKKVKDPGPYMHQPCSEGEVLGSRM
jgi:hypothetical protein